MITTIYMSGNSHDDDNGINIEIYRVNNEKNVFIKIIDDSHKPLIKSFSIDFEELKKSIEKLY